MCNSHVSHNAKINAKRKRTDLSLSPKIGVIDELDKNISQSDIARRLGISQSQDSRIAANKPEIRLRNENPDRKRCRTGKESDIVAALIPWFTEARFQD